MHIQQIASPPDLLKMAKSLEFFTQPPLSTLLVVCCLFCALPYVNAHYIQIDQNEFRTSGFPQPPLPPPLPHIDLLAQHAPARELTPVELMVDLTNELTYRILHYHSILNRNNFAFSPSALMSVLIALYEGSNGRSSLELRNVLQLPNNRDIIRVGYRDIHRRLRTYFFGSDNPLKGLSLNQDNVTITRDYETVLMFYGYDLGMDMVSSTAAPSTTTTSPTTSTTSTTDMTALNETITTTNDPSPTKTDDTTTIAVTDAPTTTTTTTEQTTTTLEPATTEAPDELQPSTTTSEETTTTEVSTEEAINTTSETDTETETTLPDAKETSELVASSAKLNEPFQRLQKPRIMRMSKAKLSMPVRTLATKTPKERYLPAKLTARSGTRNKRHLLGYKEFDANLFVTLFNQQPFQSEPHLAHNPFAIPGPRSLSVLTTQLGQDYGLDLNTHYLEQQQQHPEEGPRQNFNADVISHVFYLGNQETVHTTFKVYNAVLYYKYLDSLKISVLELELNTPEYNLMIFLPDYHTDLVTAAASLRHGPTLRVLRKQLKPKWVQSIIPDFKLHGSMFLTNDLQNIGVCDVFEPNRADFRSMTEEKGIYVKHIEQFINVNIRTRPINQLKRNYGGQTQPIQISVNHPFLFFIIDRDLDVAVMAGRVLNPLNVRIQ